MKEILSTFETTSLDPILSDACVELAELGIDSLLTDGVLKNIPIVNVLIGVGKTAQNIQDRNLLKQTLLFINSFNSKTIPINKISRYKQRINENKKFAEEELGRVIILLNSNVDGKKSELLGIFYRAYIGEEISWNSFCELSDILSRLFISDIDLLFKVYDNKVKSTKDCKSYQADRLISVGLLDTAMQQMTIGSVGGTKTDKYIQTNEIGNLFCRISLD